MGQLDLGPVLCLLTLILLALCLVGRKMHFWPIVTWPVYSTRTTRFPESAATYVDLYVVAANGECSRVSAAELFPMGRRKPFELAVQDSFESADAYRQAVNRRWLATVLQDHFSDRNLTAVEAWRVAWDVKTLEVPPSRRGRPRESVLLGSFVMSSLADRDVTTR
jgi:hypothetical protein